MNHGIEATFDSIESAHEFVGLLTEAIVDAKREIEAEDVYKRQHHRAVIQAISTPPANPTMTAFTRWVMR